MPTIIAYRPLQLFSALALFWLSLSAFAADCFDPSPSKQAGIDYFEPVKPRDITADERKLLQAMFKSLRGEWRGKAKGHFCMGTETNIRKKPDNHLISNAVVQTDSSGSFFITADMVSPEKKSTRQEKLRLYLSPNRLRAGSNNQAGDIEIISIKENSLSFMSKSHVVFRRGVQTLPQEKDLPITPQTKGSGAFIRERVITISAGEKTMTVEFLVYTQGILGSKSVWSLSRR